MGDIFSLCVCESACPPFPLLSAPLPAECLDLWLVGCCRNNQVICPGAAGGSEGEGSLLQALLDTLMQSDNSLSLSLFRPLPLATWYLPPAPSTPQSLHLHLSIFARCRQHHAQGGWHPRVAPEALQQAGVLQSLPQHVGGSRQEGPLLCAWVSVWGAWGQEIVYLNGQTNFKAIRLSTKYPRGCIYPIYI